eukprot:UN08768
MVPTQARFYLTDQNQMVWLLNTLSSITLQTQNANENNQNLFFKPSQTELEDEDDEVDAIFYFGQPLSLLLSEKCNLNDKSYCCGGEKSNYNIPYRGSILGVMHAVNFKVVNFQVFHIVK